MWLINSSIGRKVVMSVTGIALILFLTFHASMNVVALISAKGYNLICEFLGANWYAVAATVGLAALMGLHFVYAIWLSIQNRRARGKDRYAVTDKPEKVEWASQNMLVLGFIVCLGLLLHLYNFWYNMMYAELVGMEGAIHPADGTGHIVNTFAGNWCYTILYVIWLAALWFHLNHGFWSALQSIGWNGKVWFNRWRVISCVFTSVIIGMFAAVLLAFAAGYKPCDYNERPNQIVEHCDKACEEMAGEQGCQKACEKQCEQAGEQDCNKACEQACEEKAEGDCCKQKEAKADCCANE